VTKRKRGSKMTRVEVKSEILILAGNLLTGKTTIEEVDRVAKLANEHDLLDYLRLQLEDVLRSLTKKNPS